LLAKARVGFRSSPLLPIGDEPYRQDRNRQISRRAQNFTGSKEDPLTKLKLGSITEACFPHLFGIAGFLQTEYDALPPPDQLAFRDFAAWMTRQKTKYNWMPDQLNTLFNAKAQSRN
jgi:hypothetical protein